LPNPAAAFIRRGMDRPTTRPASARDPLDWIAVLTVFFLALVWHRLGTPTAIYFDEVHYVPAARKLLELKVANPEHPLLGKEIIAAAIRLLGDKPLYWRVPSALFGALGLFAFARALWWASLRPHAALAGQFLLMTGFAWYVQSRIAMLDMFMASLCMVALWMLAAAVRRPAQGRWRLAIAGVCMGLAMGAKWSVAPLWVLPGLVFLTLKLRDCRKRFLTAPEGGPVPGISLIEAAFWLGTVPLLVYWLTFAPAFFYTDRPVGPWAFVEHHRYMLQLQDSVTKAHPYRTVWYQWLSNWRGIWFLYREIDGAQRGILLIGNPFAMLAGLPAVLWCLWAGVMRQRRDALACAVLYVVSLLFWAVSGKPVQFYYHYLLPGSFLLACLALALDALGARADRARWLAPAALLVAAGMFVWFYPILSAAPLHHGKASFEHWMWLKSWR
jgi:dolichyl-phosphate-mannose--protein O-mannosyl transferase